MQEETQNQDIGNTQDVHNEAPVQNETQSFDAQEQQSTPSMEAQWSVDQDQLLNPYEDDPNLIPEDELLNPYEDDSSSIPEDQLLNPYEDDAGLIGPDVLMDPFATAESPEMDIDPYQNEAVDIDPAATMRPEDLFGENSPVWEPEVQVPEILIEDWDGEEPAFPEEAEEQLNPQLLPSKDMSNSENNADEDTPLDFDENYQNSTEEFPDFSGDGPEAWDDPNTLYAAVPSGDDGGPFVNIPTQPSYDPWDPPVATSPGGGYQGFPKSGDVPYGNVEDYGYGPPVVKEPVVEVVAEIAEDVGEDVGEIVEDIGDIFGF